MAVKPQLPRDKVEKASEGQANQLAKKDTEATPKEDESEA